MSQDPIALAVFVKTPGLSPIKTRLAAGIGVASSADFYARSVAAVEETVAAASSFGARPYWAVAEWEGLEDARWRRFSRLYQGEGGLGDRLAKVFCALREKHEVVILLGADSPQISVSLLHEAAMRLVRSEGSDAHVLGRCRDGGFYLIGSRHALEASIWKQVTYSTADTADAMERSLARLGSVYRLPLLTDVDQREDLIRLKTEMAGVDAPTQAHADLLLWLDRTIPPSQS